jgi:hypothetical protein
MVRAEQHREMIAPRKNADREPAIPPRCPLGSGEGCSPDRWTKPGRRYGLVHGSQGYGPFQTFKRVYPITVSVENEVGELNRPASWYHWEVH